MVSSRSCLAHLLLCVVLAAWNGSAAAQAQAPASQPPQPSDGPPADQAAASQTTAPAEAPTRHQLAVWASHAESDNIARTEVAPVDGSYDGLGLLLALSHQSARVEASIDGDLEYRSYSVDTVDNETIGTLNASAKFEIVEDRFSWLFKDHYGQGLSDVFAPVGPSNRDNLNALSTGPQLELPLGGRMRLDLRGEYSRRRFDQATINDSDSTLYELGLLRETTSTATIGLIANTNDIDYTETNSPSYKIESLSVRYQRMLATGRVLAEVGKNEISSGGSSNDEPLLKFEWRRSVTARSELSITAARAYTDAGTVLGTSTAGSVVGSNASEIIVTPNPYQQRRVDAQYAVRMARTNLGFGIGAFKEQYVGSSALDNKGMTWQLTVSHDISPRLRVGAGYYSMHRDYTDPSTSRPSDHDGTSSLWIDRTLARRFSIGFGASKYDRSGSQSLEETRYELRFGFSPTDSTADAMRSLGR